MIPKHTVASTSICASTILSSVLLMLWSATAVIGYSSGPPPGACDSMTPSHQQNTPRPVSGAPYYITTDKMSYSGGDTITVTVQGADANSNFKGLMLQARTKQGQRVGTFALGAGETLKLIACGNVEATAVGHTSKDLKNTITVSWMAPDMDSGNITFTATIVQQYDTFYVGILASDLYFMATTAPPSVVTTATMSPFPTGGGGGGTTAPTTKNVSGGSGSGSGAFISSHLVIVVAMIMAIFNGALPF